MRAIQLARFGGPEVLEPVDLPTPEPIPTEVRVRVHAAGVNPVDWKTRQGGARAARSATSRSSWAGTSPAWSTPSAAG